MFFKQKSWEFYIASLAESELMSNAFLLMVRIGREGKRFSTLRAWDHSLFVLLLLFFFIEAHKFLEFAENPTIFPLRLRDCLGLFCRSEGVSIAHNLMDVPDFGEYFGFTVIALHNFLLIVLH